MSCYFCSGKSNQNLLAMIPSKQGLTARLHSINIHWYSGLVKLVPHFLELGAYFTIGEEVLQSKKIQTLAKELPDHRILTETDNPTGWEWLNGEKGFPELISPVESKLAEIRGLSREKPSETIHADFRRVLKARNIPI